MLNPKSCLSSGLHNPLPSPEGPGGKSRDRDRVLARCPSCPALWILRACFVLPLCWHKAATLSPETEGKPARAAITVQFRFGTYPPMRHCVSPPVGLDNQSANNSNQK